MSGEEDAVGAEPAPLPSATSVGPSEPNPGKVVGGVFLIGCGLCLALAGGCCTAFLLFFMARSPTSYSATGDLSKSLAVLVIGIGAVILGVRLVSRPREG